MHEVVGDRFRDTAQPGGLASVVNVTPIPAPMAEGDANQKLLHSP